MKIVHVLVAASAVVLPVAFFALIAAMPLPPPLDLGTCFSVFVSALTALTLFRDYSSSHSECVARVMRNASEVRARYPLAA